MTAHQDLLAVLEERGFIHQCTDHAGLRQALAEGPLTCYLGFDATADSLHVGHLQGLMLLQDSIATERRPLSWVVGDQGVHKLEVPSQRELRRDAVITGDLSDGGQLQIQGAIDGVEFQWGE